MLVLHPKMASPSILRTIEATFCKRLFAKLRLAFSLLLR
jgi:hypothetical protein